MPPNEIYMPLNNKRFFKGLCCAGSARPCCLRQRYPLCRCPRLLRLSQSLRSQLGPFQLSFQYAGRVAAFREVEIRARVSGILQEKSFVEGAAVKAGDVLFRIDPASYEAALARAKAQLRGSAGAAFHRTQRDAERCNVPVPAADHI